MEDHDGAPPEGPGPESLLPYGEWAEAAARHVVTRALAHAAANGLPGDHHFYLTFRTDHPGVILPARLRAQYPQEMTIVLQHQFWDLVVDEAAGFFSVGLSFGGVPTTLTIPLPAIVAFADPYVQYGLRFSAPELAASPPAPAAVPVLAPASAPPAPPSEAGAGPDTDTAEAEPQVVSLDAFRRRSNPKD